MFGKRSRSVSLFVCVSCILTQLYTNRISDTTEPKCRLRTLRSPLSTADGVDSFSTAYIRCQENNASLLAQRLVATDARPRIASVLCFPA